jgi:FAD/FMN-containing dehydrogenase
MKLIDQLAAIVGSGNVLTDMRDMKPYLSDWRRQYSGVAECVIRPGSTDEVSRVVSLCARDHIALVPQGGNTGLCGGSVPSGDRRQILLSLTRMSRIRDLDRLNDTVTVEAGCVLAAVQAAADAAGRLFPLSLAAEGSCQIGGNLSTNAGGVNVLRYGMAREQVLGVEVVLADGQVWDGLRALRKNNTGYDLKQVFIGAEGTLGIITAAVLKLQPKPTASATAWIALDGPDAAVKLLAAMRERVGDRVSAFELVSRACLEAVLAHSPEIQDPLAAAHPWYVLAELSDSGDAGSLRERVESALFDSAERGALRDAVLAQSVGQGRALWRIREMIPEAQFTNVKHDVSVAVSRTPELIERAGRALESAFPGAVPYIFGHVGDGNLHFNVGPESLMAHRAAVNEIVYDAVCALGGSISAEHGIGQLKREEIKRHKNPVELRLMRALKQALDPNGLMNPGKVL